MQGGVISGHFIYEPLEKAAEPTLLYQEHLKRTSRSHIAPFAGYLMPLWFSSISDEHRAVRQAAGLFDCTHMGVLGISGPDAAGFLHFATTNDILSLNVGSARYSYILDATGNVLDDIIIYRRAAEGFMVVVNAANEPKVKAYFAALLAGEAPIDLDDPAKKLLCRPSIVDMRDPDEASDCRVDIALQGPRAVDILMRIGKDRRFARLGELRPFHFVETSLPGCPCLIAHTGYTGAKVGFELFVHPDHAVQLWNLLLEQGKDLGLLPCGLGARDSLRIEAGLPLYGHELDGPYNIGPTDAGYGWAVKMDKDFFIGKNPLQRAAKSSRMAVARAGFPGEQGIRPLRQDDPILDGQGRCMGWVLSCAKIEQRQIALAYVLADAAQQDRTLGAYYLARSPRQLEEGRLGKAGLGQALRSDLQGTVLSRFARF